MDIQPPLAESAMDFVGFERIVDRMLPLVWLQGESAAMAAFWNASPGCPHLVLDEAFDAEMLDRLAAECPTPRGAAEPPVALARGIAALSPFAQTFLWRFAGAGFLDWLRGVTGIHDLVADGLWLGGGLRSWPAALRPEPAPAMPRHPHLPLLPRIAVTIDLTRDWSRDWGGTLRLGNTRRPQEPGPSIAPRFNRLVVMPLGDEVVREIEGPLDCPPGELHRSAVLLFWSPDPAAAAPRLAAPPRAPRFLSPAAAEAQRVLRQVWRRGRA